MASRIEQIGAAIDGAEDAPQFAETGDVRPFGGREADDEMDAPALPPECPVQCLGVMDQDCFYLDYNGQIIRLPMGNKHGKNNLAGLFGPTWPWLEQAFPQWSKPVKERRDGGEWVEVEPSRIVGFKQDEASRALIVECTRRGIFDPAGRIRGAGAHRLGHDGLALHCGNTVMLAPLRINGEAGGIDYVDTGLHGHFVYPAAAPIPRPWPEPVGERAGEIARGLIASWHWKRPLLDPLLILGGIGASLIGGALEWRANIWITGGRGTGKSTLNGKHGLLDQMMGKAQLRSADTTAAGIRQRLRNSTVPVFLDELEAEEDQRRTRSILELARVSSSGDDAHRGGQDHQAMEFSLQSAFWASSILIPPMEPQDRSRWAVCALKPFDKGARKPDFKAARLPELGRKLLRRMVDGWARWQATYDAYRDALGEMGHSARACDQFGTLLAAADLLLYDGLPDAETIEATAQLCDVASLREVADAAEEHELCLDHMRTSMVQSRGGDERQSIGTWIGAAVQALCDPGARALSGGTIDCKEHNRLQEIGLKLVTPTGSGCRTWEPGQPGFLAVANAHQGIAAIFAGKKWAGGVWAQALGRCPGAIEGRTAKFGRGSKAMRATLVPLEAVIDEGEIPGPARWSTGQDEGAA